MRKYFEVHYCKILQGIDRIYMLIQAQKQSFLEDTEWTEQTEYSRKDRIFENRQGLKIFKFLLRISWIMLDVLKGKIEDACSEIRQILHCGLAGFTKKPQQESLLYLQNYPLSILIIIIHLRQNLVTYMIEMKICELCKQDFVECAFQEHTANCSPKKTEMNADRTKALDMTSDKEGKTTIVQVQLPELQQNGYSNKQINFLSRKCSDILAKDGINNSFLSSELFQQGNKLFLEIKAKDELDENIKQETKKMVEEQLNNYKVVSLQIGQDNRENAYHLQDQYNLQIDQKSVSLIVPKDEAVKIISCFYKDFLALEKLCQKIDLSSQILQYTIQRQKEIEDVLKVVPMILTNQNKINIKTKKTDKYFLVFISGFKESVDTCKEYFYSILENKSINSCSKKYLISPEELKLLKKHRILDEYKDVYGIKFEQKEFNISRLAEINQSKMLLLFNESILTFPKTAAIILPFDQMAEIRQLQESNQFLKAYLFFGPESKDETVEVSVSQFVNYYIEKDGQIGVILPKEDKTEFMLKLSQILKGSNKRMKLYLLQRENERKAIEAFDEFNNSEKKWYALINKNKVYYPEKVNKLIQQSAIIGTDIIVNHEQLEIKKKTHVYNYQLGQIIHKSTGIPSLIQDQDDFLMVFINEETYYVKKQTKHDTEITCAIYEIKLRDKLQRNIITDKYYQISYEAVKKKNNEPVLDDLNQIELTLIYPDLESIDKIWEYIKKQLDKRRFIHSYDIEGIKPEKMKEIQNWCRIQKIKFWSTSSIMTAQTFNQLSLNNLETLIEIHKKKVLAGVVEFPAFWNMSQSKDLQLYTINSSDEEFEKVQKAFRVGKIKKLERIQNKILFEKYSNQKIFLSEKNEQTVRQVMMFHGTRMNPPEKIYNDHQQSFNINYANMGSFGKGIYFAKNSQYSHTYCYSKNASEKQMFYCLVLAGHSQVYNGKQQFDTSYRVQSKKIRYQSVVNNTKQEIMVVFKNRRAYPLYLITY